MSKYGFSSDSHSITRIVTFVLVSLFAVLAMFVVMTGIRAYSGVNAASEQNARERAALSYVVNRIRSADCGGGVEIASDGKSVSLKDNIDGEVFATTIYCANGRLMEYFGYYGDGWDESDGETITQADGIELSRADDGLVAVEVIFADGERTKTRVALRCADQSGRDAR